MSLTIQEFNAAIERLLGTSLYDRLSHSCSPSHFCTEVAQMAFTGRLQSYPEQAADLALVRRVAHRLWHEDGITGLAPQVVRGESS